MSQTVYQNFKLSQLLLFHFLLVGLFLHCGYVKCKLVDFFLCTPEQRVIRMLLVRVLYQALK